RHYLNRAATALVLLLALGLGLKLFGDRNHAEETLKRAFTAKHSELPAIVGELGRYRSLLMGKLEAKETEGLSHSHEREVAGLLLYRFAPTRARGEYLHRRLLDATSPDEVEPICDALASHPDHADVAALRARLENVATVPTARLSLATALMALE